MLKISNSLLYLLNRHPELDWKVAQGKTDFFPRQRGIMTLGCWRMDVSMERNVTELPKQRHGGRSGIQARGLERQRMCKMVMLSIFITLIFVTVSSSGAQKSRYFLFHIFLCLFIYFLVGGFCCWLYRLI